LGIADLFLGVDEQDLAGDGVEDEAVGDRSAHVAGADDGDAGGEVAGRHYLLWWVSSAVAVWEYGCNNICYSYLIIVHRYVIFMYVMSGPCMQKSRLPLRIPLVVLVLGNCGVCHVARNASAPSRVLQFQ
jgi:hypothetical protein